MRFYFLWAILAISARGNFGQPPTNGNLGQPNPTTSFQQPGQCVDVGPVCQMLCTPCGAGPGWQNFQPNQMGPNALMGFNAQGSVPTPNAQMGFNAQGSVPTPNAQMGFNTQGSVQTPMDQVPHIRKKRDDDSAEGTMGVTGVAPGVPQGAPGQPGVTANGAVGITVGPGIPPGQPPFGANRPNGPVTLGSAVRGTVHDVRGKVGHLLQKWFPRTYGAGNGQFGYPNSGMGPYSGMGSNPGMGPYSGMGLYSGMNPSMPYSSPAPGPFPVPVPVPVPVPMMPMPMPPPMFPFFPPPWMQHGGPQGQQNCLNFLAAGRQLIEAFCPVSCGVCGNTVDVVTAAQAYVNAQCTAVQSQRIGMFKK